MGVPITAIDSFPVVPSVEAGVNTEHPFDYVVVTMKNLPDVYSIPDIIRPAISAHTAIVLIQNGIYIEEPILQAFPQCTVISGVSMIGAHQYDGRIIHDDPDDVGFGVFFNPNLPKESQQARLEEFVQIYGIAAPLCKTVPDIVWSRWRKLVWNGTFNTLCALTGLDCSRIRYFGGENLLRPAMEELNAIAKADGYVLPDDIIETMIEIEPLDVFCRPSMLVDVDKGNPMEIEVILGSPLRIARKLGVSTPVLDSIYKMLKLIQCRNLEKRGLLKMPEKIPVHEGV